MKYRPDKSAIIKPLAPLTKRGTPMPGWSYRGPIPAEFELHVWDHDYGFRVLSAVEVVEGEVDPESNGPHYHLSITAWPDGAKTYADASDAAYILRTYFGGLEGWEEDNHVPGGVARNFFRPVAERLIGKECWCKAHEPLLKEHGGDYEWRPI